MVEVLFATATASLLIVITLVIMNRNLAQIQMSSETTFVRQAIDSQAEVLRYMRDQYTDNPGAELKADSTPTFSKLWKDMVDSSRPGTHAQATATDFGTCQPDDTGTITAPATSTAFFIDHVTAGSSSSNAEADAADVQNISLSTNLALSQTYALSLIHI